MSLSSQSSIVVSSYFYEAVSIQKQKIIDLIFEQQQQINEIFYLIIFVRLKNVGHPFLMRQSWRIMWMPHKNHERLFCTYGYAFKERFMSDQMVVITLMVSSHGHSYTSKTFDWNKRFNAWSHLHTNNENTIGRTLQFCYIINVRKHW